VLTFKLLTSQKKNVSASRHRQSPQDPEIGCSICLVTGTGCNVIHPCVLPLMLSFASQPQILWLYIEITNFCRHKEQLPWP